MNLTSRAADEPVFPVPLGLVAFVLIATGAIVLAADGLEDVPAPRAIVPIVTAVVAGAAAFLVWTREDVPGGAAGLVAGLAALLTGGNAAGALLVLLGSVAVLARGPWAASRRAPPARPGDPGPPA